MTRNIGAKGWSGECCRGFPLLAGPPREYGPYTSEISDARSDLWWGLGGGWDPPKNFPVFWLKMAYYGVFWHFKKSTPTTSRSIIGGTDPNKIIGCTCLGIPVVTPTTGSGRYQWSDQVSSFRLPDSKPA